MRRRSWLIPAAVLVLLTACGGGDGIGEDASRELEPRVAQVRAAVERQDRAAADQALSDLKARLDELYKVGELNQDELIAIQGAIRRVEAEVATAVTTTTTTSTTTTTTTRPAPRDEKDEGRGEGEKKKGEGRGDDDD